MDVEIPVLAGYLNVPTQTGFSLNRISKKKPCNRYCLLFKSSRHGIERLEICENKDDKNPKIFTLENCVKITQEPPPANLIQIVKKNGTLTLNTLTDEELKEWVTALQTVAFCDNSGAHATHGAIEEDNDLYCSSYDGLFLITLIPSEASIRCNIEQKDYMLEMTATELQLKSVEDLNVIIAMWPYRFIRKYGYRDGKFTFEAGRKCTTGEGVFTLDHKTPQEVFRCMSAKMKSMKKLISGDSLNSIDCGENQFSAAASMEPGSRSPLPPSPSNNQHAGEFEINSTQSCISLRGFISSNDSLNNYSSSNNSATVLLPSVNIQPTAAALVKHIPNKPPRKLPTTLEVTPPPPGVGVGISCDKYKKIMNYEPVAITTSSLEHNKNATGSTVILKPPSPEMLLRSNSNNNSNNSNNNLPPDLPLRNESAKQQQQQQQFNIERDYECIENITDAWKTLGVNDVKHCERNCDNDATNTATTLPFEFVWQRSQSQRDKRTTHKDNIANLVAASSAANTPKIIDIDIGEISISGNSNSCPATASADAAYDRLDFLSPNNKTSSGYKTIVNVMSPGNRQRCCSPPTPNEYELIASPDIEICRKADDSHLGYGVLRKAITTTPTTTTIPSSSIGQCPLKSNLSANHNNTNNNNNNNNITAIINNQNNNFSTNTTTTSEDVLSTNKIRTLPTTPTSPNQFITTTSLTPQQSSGGGGAAAAAVTTTQLNTTHITNKNNNNECLDHRSYNGISYTIVSKPKRV